MHHCTYTLYHTLPNYFVHHCTYTLYHTLLRAPLHIYFISYTISCTTAHILYIIHYFVHHCTYTLYHTLPNYCTNKKKSNETFVIIIIIIIILKRLAMQCREREINTISVRRPQLHNTNPYRIKEEMETKTEQPARPIKRHWPCSWNPPIPNHRIRGHQDRSRATDRGINVLRYCKVLQRGGASKRRTQTHPQLKSWHHWLQGPAV